MPNATSIYSLAWRALIVLVSLQIATVSVLRYLTPMLPPPPPIVENVFASPFLTLHVISGVAALLLGPLQLVASLRTRRAGIHRFSGRLYVLACAIGAPSGLILALGTTAGPIAGSGFAILGVLWAVFTWLGWRAAVERRIDEHREWMLRSYAMVAAAITLRLMLPAAGALGFGFVDAYQVIAWISWMTNLAVVEYWIRRKRHAVFASTELVTT